MVIGPCLRFFVGMGMRDEKTGLREIERNRDSLQSFRVSEDEKACRLNSPPHPNPLAGSRRSARVSRTGRGGKAPPLVRAAKLRYETLWGLLEFHATASPVGRQLGSS